MSSVSSSKYKKTLMKKKSQGFEFEFSYLFPVFQERKIKIC